MNGKLGAIYSGNRQIGGFLDWKVALNLADGIDGDDRTHKLQSWRVVAFAHWVTKRLDTGLKVRIRLCSDVGYAYWEGTGMIISQPTQSIQTLLHQMIEIIGSDELEAKEMPHG